MDGQGINRGSWVTGRSEAEHNTIVCTVFMVFVFFWSRLHIYRHYFFIIKRKCGVFFLLSV